jgi:hypothetical protein
MDGERKGTGRKTGVGREKGRLGLRRMNEVKSELRNTSAKGLRTEGL